MKCQFDDLFYAQAENAVDEMCKAIKQRNTQKAAEMFAKLVQQLRQCNRDTVEKQAKKMLARQDTSER